MRKLTQFALTATVLMSFATASAAVTAKETRSKMDASMKAVKVESLQGDALKRSIETVSKDLAKTQGISETQIESAIRDGQGKVRELKADVGGENLNINMLATAKQINAAKSTVDALAREKSQLDTDGQELLTQLERAMEIMPKFLSLANSVSSGSSAEVQAFVKQLSLTKEMLSTMDAADLKNHLDVMEMAVEVRLRNPEINGDEAYSQALRTKYQDKYASKLEEILSCKR